MSENRIKLWGESMYGGYYADLNVVTEGVDTHVCLHAETMRELRNQIESYGIKPILSKNRRLDNC